MISLRMSLRLAFVLAILWTFVDARSHETLVMRISNPDYQPSDKQMLAMLKKVDLESHGYKKELTTKLVSEAGSDKPLYEKRFLYFKIVDCSRLQEIIQELQTLVPDTYDVKLVTKIDSEIKARNLTNMKQCKVGLEVHFKDSGNCAAKKSTTRRKKRAPCWMCWGCNHIEASN